MNDYKFEDLKIGMEEHFSVVITDEMLSSFRVLSGDENPLHCDVEFAKQCGFTNKVVYGLLTASFVSKLGGVLLPGKYCLIQSVSLDYLKPVYVGDTLLVSGTVKDLHESVQQAEIKIEIRNQDNKKVVKGILKVGFLKERV